MKLGEICLHTNNVVRLANFYKFLLDVENGSYDERHQILIETEPQFTIYNDGSQKKGNNQNFSLAFTVDDIYAQYERLLSYGVQIIEKPTKRPWGTINLSFLDPDGNLVFLRSFLS